MKIVFSQQCERSNVAESVHDEWANEVRICITFGWGVGWLMVHGANACFGVGGEGGCSCIIVICHAWWLLRLRDYEEEEEGLSL